MTAPSARPRQEAKSIILPNPSFTPTFPSPSSAANTATRPKVRSTQQAHESLVVTTTEMSHLPHSLRSASITPPPPYPIPHPRSRIHQSKSMFIIFPVQPVDPELSNRGRPSHRFGPRASRTSLQQKDGPEFRLLLTRVQIASSILAPPILERNQSWKDIQPE
jgi:hypothetical protein